MAVHPQKITKALSRLTKALDACTEAGLQLHWLPAAEVQKGDYAVVEGKLDKIVAVDSQKPGVVALENAGAILTLRADRPYLVVRPS